MDEPRTWICRPLKMILPLVLTMQVSGCSPANPEGVAGVHDKAKKPEVRIENELRGPKEQTKSPKQPPTYFGIVERIERRSIGNSEEFEAVLIKGHPPLEGLPQPSSPLFINGQPDLLWLNLPNTKVERRSGPITVGQYVWVWHPSGKAFLTEPSQIYPDFVVSEFIVPKKNAIP